MSRNYKFHNPEGIYDPIDSDQGVLALRFKEIVEKTSGGAYKIDIFPAGQLGDEQKKNIMMSVFLNSKNLDMPK